jgi:hypothetical protein
MRLIGQKEAVYSVLSRGGWWSLAELAEETGHPEASISARIRDLRKPKFGGYNVPGHRRTQGTWEYGLVSDLPMVTDPTQEPGYWD